MRSQSTAGLNVNYIEFDWTTEIRAARQTIQERLSTLEGILPDGIRPQMTPPQFKRGDGSVIHADGTKHARHGGHGAGPHDGTVADWGGGKYHIEILVDHDKQESTVFILGSDEKSSLPIEAQSIDLSISDPVMQVMLTAAPQSSDPAGKSSRFIGKHEKLDVVQEYAGTIAGVIDGTPYL